MRLPARFFNRKKSSHKGDFGHILVIAGSRRYVGAAFLSAQAALRSGAGLVTLGFPEGLYQVFARRLTEVMLLPLPQTAQGGLSGKGFPILDSFLKGVDVLLIGPGVGREAETQKLVLRLIRRAPVPAVIDADALFALASDKEILKKRSPETVLTPHAGEMARLSGVDVSRVSKARKNIAKDFALRYNITLLLKGRATIVASPRGQLYVNRTGNPGMASAGSGDVLAGVIAGFMAQRFSGFNAACCGAYVHGLAGDKAAVAMTQPGLIASDIVDRLPMALKSCCASLKKTPK